MAMAVARDHVRAERSPAVVALLSITSAAGVGLGYPISGWLSETVGFHPTFVFAAAIAGLALVGAAYAIPSSSHRAHRPLDLGGGVVLAIGVSAIVVALSEATAWGGRSVAFLGFVVVGVVALVGWVYHQLHVTHPVIDLRTLAKPSVRVAQSTALLAGVGLYFLLSLVVRYVETPRSTGYGLGRSVLVTGLLLVPFSAASLVVNRALPLLRRWPGSHWLLSSGSFAFIASMGFFVFARSSLWELCITLALAGLGLGMCYASMPQLIVAAVPAHETGSALGFNQVLRIIGGAIGSATSAAVLAASTKSGSKFPLDIGYTRAAYVALGVWVVTLILSWPRRSLILVSVEHLIEEESVDAAVAGAIIYELDPD
jgi:predicted MFS family arabinose efflux permease